MYPVCMPDCVRLSRQLVLSSNSRRRLDTNYEIFDKSRPPTTSSLQVQRRVKRLVFKSGLLQGPTKICKIEKTDFLILCQNEGPGEIVPKKEVSGRSGFSFFFPAIFHNLCVAAA